MATGLLIGVSIGVGILAGITIPGVSWLVAVGLVKLALVGSGGLLAAGATLHRLAGRRDDRARLGE